MANQLGNLVESIKSKVRSLKLNPKKAKKPYLKMDKSASVKVEIRSRKARKLIEKTLKSADSPGNRSLSQLTFSYLIFHFFKSHSTNMYILYQNSNTLRQFHLLISFGISRVLGLLAQCYFQLSSFISKTIIPQSIQLL